MNNYFDEDSQKLIVNAKKEMLELKHPYVGTEHLLLAILKDKKLKFNSIFNSYGISYDIFKNNLIDIIGIGSKGNEWFLFTPLLKKVINNASFYNNNRFVTPYCLVVSLLHEGDGIANRILLNMDIQTDELFKEFCDFSTINLDANSRVLDTLAVNMNNQELNNRYDPLIGRDNEINHLIQILLRKNKNNPLLIGKPGVGKTAIVEELARRINQGKVPNKLKKVTIYNLSLSMLVSGTKYRGEFEEKLNKIIKEITGNPNIILFIDEFHTIMGAGGAEGAIDASNILKPYLARDEIKVIGATTIEEYNKIISKDKAFDRRFQKIIINEPNSEELKKILLKLKPIYEKYHLVNISNNVIDKIISLSNNCIFQGNQPDKAIDLLDEVSSFVNTFNNKTENSLNNLFNDIEELKTRKNNSIINHNFKEAIKYKNQELELRNNYNHIMINETNKKTRIKLEDLYYLVSLKTNIPNNKKLKANKTIYEESLEEEININNNIKKIINTIIDYDYYNRNLPLSMLFVTKDDIETQFLVSKIAKIMFDEKLINIDLTDYPNKESITKLLGTYPGYVGYNDESDFLKEIKNKTFSVLLIENIDKCNKSVLSIFMNIIDKGHLNTGKGYSINLTKSIVIFTMKSKIDIGFNNSISKIPDELKKIRNIFVFDNQYSIYNNKCKIIS